MREAIDFNVVPFAHERIDERLKNWARWVTPRPTSWVAPMWRGFKASEVWTGASVSIPLDPLDAQRLEKAVSALPEAHKFAVRWCYVYRGNPARAARHIGETQEGLARLIADGRTMLLNRRA